MANDYFQFKKFIVHQERCAMKVGTDSVLIGAWANVDKATRVLDIGSGSGIISLMIAQRCEAEIDAVEIEEQAYLQSLENFEKSPWPNRIQVFKEDFRNFAKNSVQQYDLVISNPPFFVNSSKTNHVEVNLARHNDLLPFKELVKGAEKLMTDNAKLALVLPYAEGSVFIAEAVKMGLFCLRKTLVKPKHHTPVKRLLLEFSKIPSPCQEDFLVITNEENQYTEKYAALTRDFYLFV